MRLQNYINEENIDEMVLMIQKNCQPFLKEINHNFLYRGYKNKIKSIKKVITRTDRKPLGSSEEDHANFNKLFKKKFGWKARSEGVFCSSNTNDVRQYGNVNLVFPIGKYQYVWSPKVTDLTLYIEDYYDYEEDFGSWEDFLQWIVSTYKDKDLIKAIEYKSEISIKCKEYYLVHPFYGDKLRRKL